MVERPDSINDMVDTPMDTYKSACCKVRRYSGLQTYRFQEYVKSRETKSWQHFSPNHSKLVSFLTVASRRYGDPQLQILALTHSVGSYGGLFYTSLRRVEVADIRISNPAHTALQMSQSVRLDKICIDSKKQEERPKLPHFSLYG